MKCKTWEFKGATGTLLVRWKVNANHTVNTHPLKALVCTVVTARTSRTTATQCKYSHKLMTSQFVDPNNTVHFRLGTSRNSPLNHEHAVKAVLSTGHHATLSLDERRQRAVTHHSLRFFQLLRLLPVTSHQQHFPNSS